MEVPGAASGPAGVDRATAARDVVPRASADAVGRAAPPGADSVAALLRELSESNLARLLGIVEGAPAPGREAQVRELLQAAVAAVAEEDPTRALARLQQLASLDAGRAEALASEPALESIRPAVEQLVSQLAAAAKLNAEGRLAEASRLFETAATGTPPASGVSPEVFLQVATRLIEAGGLANYVRSAAVSAALVEEFRWAPPPYLELPPARAPAGRSRVPVGFLLLAWLAAGMAGAGVYWWLPYDRWQDLLAVWGGGLLVLACFAAWRSVRPS